jgi:hypothetical protein
MNRPPWNLKFNRAKAYPAVAEATRVIKVPTPATHMVLRMNLPNGR